MKKFWKNRQRGEIITTLTLIGLGVLVAGIFAGRQLAQQGTRLLPRAEIACICTPAGTCSGSCGDKSGASCSGPTDNEFCQEGLMCDAPPGAIGACSSFPGYVPGNCHPALAGEPDACDCGELTDCIEDGHIFCCDFSGSSACYCSEPNCQGDCRTQSDGVHLHQCVTYTGCPPQQTRVCYCSEPNCQGDCRAQLDTLHLMNCVSNSACPPNAPTVTPRPGVNTPTPTPIGDWYCTKPCGSATCVDCRQGSAAGFGYRCSNCPPKSDGTMECDMYCPAGLCSTNKDGGICYDPAVPGALGHGSPPVAYYESEGRIRISWSDGTDGDPLRIWMDPPPSSDPNFPEDAQDDDLSSGWIADAKHGSTQVIVNADTNRDHTFLFGVQDKAGCTDPEFPKCSITATYRAGGVVMEVSPVNPKTGDTIDFKISYADPAHRNGDYAYFDCIDQVSDFSGTPPACTANRMPANCVDQNPNADTNGGIFYWRKCTIDTPGNYIWTHDWQASGESGTRRNKQHRFTIESAVPLSPPTNLKLECTQNAQKIKLSWDPIPGATFAVRVTDSDAADSVSIVGIANPEINNCGSAGSSYDVCYDGWNNNSITLSLKNPSTKTYKWWVHTRNTAGSLSDVAVGPQYTVPQPPSNLQYFTKLEDNGEYTANFNWAAPVKGAMRYNFYVNKGDTWGTNASSFICSDHGVTGSATAYKIKNDSYVSNPNWPGDCSKSITAPGPYYARLVSASYYLCASDPISTVFDFLPAESWKNVHVGSCDTYNKFSAGDAACKVPVNKQIDLMLNMPEATSFRWYKPPLYNTDCKITGSAAGWSDWTTFNQNPQGVVVGIPADTTVGQKKICVQFKASHNTPSNIVEAKYITVEDTPGCSDPYEATGNYPQQTQNADLTIDAGICSQEDEDLVPFMPDRNHVYTITLKNLSDDLDIMVEDFNAEGLPSKNDPETVSSQSTNPQTSDESITFTPAIKGNKNIRIFGKEDSSGISNRISKYTLKITAASREAIVDCPAACNYSSCPADSPKPGRNHGDANCDCYTDANDFGIWLYQYQDSKKANPVITNPAAKTANFNCSATNRSVDMDDFVIWKDEFMSLP